MNTSFNIPITKPQEFFYPNNNDPSPDKITNFFLNKRSEGIKHVLLFAMGGGNDTFSAIPIAEYLHDLHFDVTVYGILGFTPFHCEPHTLDQSEKPLSVPSESLQRFIMLKSAKKILNTEHLLPKILDSLQLNHLQVKLLSSKYTPSVLSKTIADDLEKQGRTLQESLVVGADFGADVITSGQPTTFSPDLDATSLQTICNIACEKIGLICYPGIDGELSPEDLKGNMSRLHSLGAARVNPSSKYIDILKKIYGHLENLRQGNTIPLTLDILSNESQECISRKVKKKHQVNAVRIDSQYPITLDLSIAQKIHLIELESIKKINLFANIEYHDLLEYFVKVMEVYDACENNYEVAEPYFVQKSTDFHLQFLRLDSEGLWTSKELKQNPIIQILICPSAFSKDDKKSVMEEGLKSVSKGDVDFSLLSKKQIEEIGLPLDETLVEAFSAGKYILLTQKCYANQFLIEETCEKIKKCQLEDEQK